MVAKKTKKTSLSKKTKKKSVNKKPVKKNTKKSKTKKTTATKRKVSTKTKRDRRKKKTEILASVEFAEPVDKIIILSDEELSSKHEVIIEEGEKVKVSDRSIHEQADEIFHTFGDIVERDEHMIESEDGKKQKKQIVTHHDQLITDIAHEVNHNKKHT